MTINTGHISIAVVAGDIRATTQPVEPKLGQQVRMGDTLFFHIKPEVARQWIGVLEPIAKEEQ